MLSLDGNFTIMEDIEHEKIKARAFDLAINDWRKNDKEKINQLCDVFLEKRSLEKLKELDVEPYRIEGLNTDWILIDFGDIIVHFFTEEKRVFYNLEKVWADGIVLENN